MNGEPNPITQKKKKKTLVTFPSLLQPCYGNKSFEKTIMNWHNSWITFQLHNINKEYVECIGTKVGSQINKYFTMFKNNMGNVILLNNKNYVTPSGHYVEKIKIP